MSALMTLILALVDFGLVVLILMVQRMVYPSFAFFDRQKLIAWHQKYTPRIAAVVGPLMILQLVLSAYQLMEVFNIAHLAHLLLVLAVWIYTALFFVPIHKRIGEGGATVSDLKRLVSGNWLRVTLWVLIFLITLRESLLRLF